MSGVFLQRKIIDTGDFPFDFHLISFLCRRNSCDMKEIFEFILKLIQVHFCAFYNLHCIRAVLTKQNKHYVIK